MADSPAFIFRTLRGVGFSSSAAVVGTAIVLAESGGNRTAFNGSCCHGWWQINLGAHPEVTRSCAYDPVCASRFAYQLSQGGRRWTPWSVFTSGAYRGRLDVAQQAAQTPSRVPDRQAGLQGRPCNANGVPGFQVRRNGGRWGPCTPLDPGAAANTVGDALPAIGELVKRIAIGAAGVALLIVGLMMIASDVTLSQAATRFGKAIKGVTS